VIDAVWTPKQLAEKWMVKSDTILALIRSGELRAFNVGRRGALKPRWRINADAVVQFEEQRGPAGPKTRSTRPKRQASDDYVAYF
jgi:excisionase family DNA binding protein